MSNKLACQLMSWFSIRVASLLPVAMLSTCTNQLDFRLVVIMCIFFQPLFEKVSNYACHIPWSCFQLFTFHSRSRGAPPLLWRRGGLALCWSMLLATKMGSSRPPQMFWFQSCFDFQMLTYWLLRSVCVCVTPAVQGAFEPTKFWGPTVVVYTQIWYILCTLWYT